MYNITLKTGDENMSDNFPIMPIYVNKKVDNNYTSKLKYYSVQYDYDKMTEFLEKLKEKYSQTFREYGTIEDIAKLQYYKVMDSTFEEEKNRYRLVVKVINKGRCGKPDDLLYRYTKYPAIYKLIKNILDDGLFDLQLLCNYLKQLEYTNKLQTMDLEFTAKLTGINKIDFYSDNYFLENRKKMVLFTDVERKLSNEEYNEIVTEFFKLLKFKNCSTKIVDATHCIMAVSNSNYINNNLFEKSKLIKDLRKKYSL